MAYIYMSGGWVLNVPLTREQIIGDLGSAPTGGVIECQVDARSGAATRPVAVSIAVEQIAFVADEPIP